MKYKEKTISDVLNMTVEEAVVFFSNQPKIARNCRPCWTWVLVM